MFCDDVRPINYESNQKYKHKQKSYVIRQLQCFFTQTIVEHPIRVLQQCFLRILEKTKKIEVKIVTKIRKRLGKSFLRILCKHLKTFHHLLDFVQILHESNVIFILEMNLI